VREVESIAQGLADIARDLNVCVIVLSQLQGAAEYLKGDELPNMAHFKESQGIPENSDTIMTLHNASRHENPFNDAGEWVVPILKCKVEQRYDVSGAVVEIRADLRTCQFSGIETHREPQPNTDNEWRDR